MHPSEGKTVPAPQMEEQPRLVEPTFYERICKLLSAMENCQLDVECDDFPPHSIGRPKGVTTW